MVKDLRAYIIVISVNDESLKDIRFIRTEAVLKTNTASVVFDNTLKSG